VNTKSDRELLNAYSTAQSEAAFAEIVRRHVDAVYSTALRIIVDPHLAEDVTQATFVALAQNAPTLARREVLSGWLHVTTRNVAAKTVRTEERRRSREKEASLMHSESSAPDDVWNSFAAFLDDALGHLSDADRDALLLRFFERQTAPEIAQRLNLSVEAAQKRVSRALERLRDLLAKSGCALPAAAIGASLSIQAVQAAPASLAASACGAAMTAAAVSAGSTVGVLKLMLMTKLNAVCLGAAVVAATIALYKAQEVSTWRGQAHALDIQQAALTEQVQRLTSTHEDTAVQVAALREENERLSQNTGELLRLRGELARLKGNAGQGNTASTSTQNDPVYDGKTWSQWLVDIGNKKPKETRDAAAKAIREIGPQILPRVMEEIDASLPAEDGASHDDRLSRATLAFAALGTNAAAAIPELLARTEKFPGYVPNALASIGPAAVPALQQCLTNTRSYNTSAGEMILLPGNTIGALYNALHAGQLSKSDVVDLMPAIRDWASTNKNSAQYNYAADFLRDFDH
jgi:RNA polymerase sigma factor (sigma-70 family)